MNRVPLLGLALLLLLTGCSREPEKTAAPEPTATGSQGQAIDPEQAMSPTELAAKADVPLYPEADTPDGKSNFSRNGAETKYELVMTTPDPAAKVLKFYESHLSRSQKIGSKLMGLSKKGNSVSVGATTEAGLTTISVVSIVMTNKV